ncbi:MAG TPA: MGMT family protein [Euzebya sp.]|nr:MGMT family protein [Euzebya sp.]
MTSTTDDFPARVESIVAGLLPGTCASYGEIAAEAGRPGAARAVGNLMGHFSHLPWWRVIRADGTLPVGDEQARRLRADGLEVVGGPDRWRVRPRG